MTSFHGQDGRRSPDPSTERDGGGTGAGAVAERGRADVPGDEGETEQEEQAMRSSNKVTLLVIVSRITGFFRTTAQAWALGAYGLASAYTVANNLPNLLYELVVGGMLITAFLPVYLSVKVRLGDDASSEYASNLLSLVVIIMVACTVLCFAFAVPIVWTQSAGASEGFDSDLAVWFFRWFAVEIILYACSSIVSGVLNAERDYVASYAAPIFNNVIVILSFAIYVWLQGSGAPSGMAMLSLAIGNPLGVLVQVLVQIPAIKRHGVRFHWRVDVHDPNIRETVTIGLPTLVVTLASTPTTAVTSSCALSVTAAGASIAYYARVWYVLPYSVFAIPISTTMFTELSHSHIEGDTGRFKSYFAEGSSKILFTIIPFALYLIVFAECLVAVLTSGSFTSEAATQTTIYLQVLALSLPFYALSSYLQKACASLMRMKFFAIATCVASAIQIVVCIWLTPVFGLYLVPFSSLLFYGLLDLVVVVNIRRELGPLGLRSVLVNCLWGLVFGFAGSLVGSLIVHLMVATVGPCSGILRGILYAVVGGVPAVLVTFGGARLFHRSKAPFFDALFDRLGSSRARLGR